MQYMIEPPAVIVDFPLRGEWRALNTPGERVPSHGTNYFGQRYAFDFAKMDERGEFFYPGALRALVRHFTTGLSAPHFFCWDEPVYSAASGTVVNVGEGWPDRKHVHAAWGIVRSSLLGVEPSGRDYRPLAGNFVIVESDSGFILYAHLRRGSIRVKSGDKIEVGAQLGTVGNSGNSTMPHLHFHVMDAADPLAASGVPCCFREYERWSEGRWVPARNAIPRCLERIRNSGDASLGSSGRISSEARLA